MSFANVRPSSMRHCLCVACWTTLHGDAPAHTVAANIDPPDTCCRCGTPATVATYVRDAPSAFFCMGNHGGAADARPTSVIEGQIACPTCGLPALVNIPAIYDPANLHTLPDGRVGADKAFYSCELCKHVIAVSYTSVMRDENTRLGDLLDRLTRDNGSGSGPLFPR